MDGTSMTSFTKSKRKDEMLVWIVATIIHLGCIGAIAIGLHLRDQGSFYLNAKKWEISNECW